MRLPGSFPREAGGAGIRGAADLCRSWNAYMGAVRGVCGSFGSRAGAACGDRVLCGGGPLLAKRFASVPRQAATRKRSVKDKTFPKPKAKLSMTRTAGAGAGRRKLNEKPLPPDRVRREGRLGARFRYCCDAMYSSAILRTAAARFSLSGCEENIFCTVDALAPCDSSTSFSSDAAMP